MNDIVELLHDPDFATDFIFKIAGGERLDSGEFVESVTCHKKRGVIQPASHKDTEYLVDGDKYRRAIKIWLSEYISAADKRAPQLGDIIEWNCSEFRVVSNKDWSQYGYWQAVAVEITGGENE